MFAHTLWRGAASGGPSKRAKLSPLSANAAACSAKVQKPPSHACQKKKRASQAAPPYNVLLWRASSKPHRRTNFVLRTAQTAAIDLECSKPQAAFRVFSEWLAQGCIAGLWHRHRSSLATEVGTGDDAKPEAAREVVLLAAAAPGVLAFCIEGNVTFNAVFGGRTECWTATA